MKDIRLNTTFYNIFNDIINKDNKNYYYMSLDNILKHTIYVRINKKAFSFIDQILIKVFGFSQYENLISSIVQAYLLEPTLHLGAYFFDIDDTLSVVRVQDLCYLNKKVFNNNLILQAKDKFNCDIWKIIEYYMPDINLSINYNVSPIDNKVQVSFAKIINAYGTIEDANYGDYYAYKINLLNAKGLSKLDVEYVLVYAFLSVLNNGFDTNFTLNVDINGKDLYENLNYSLIQNIVSYYDFNKINVILELANRVYINEPLNMLKFVSNKCNMPIFIVQYFLRKMNNE